MAWITPVTDRTASDASYADKHKDAATQNKGALNIDTELNHIEGNCEYLSNQLNSYGYPVSITTKTNWVKADYPYKAELDRIRSNIQALLTAYYTLTGSPAMDFELFFDWDDMNDLEQNIMNMKTLLERMIAGFRHCGGFNFFAGSEVVLP